MPPQEATIDGDPALHENIRVPGSHVGLVINGIVLAIIANRLAERIHDLNDGIIDGMLAILDATPCSPASLARRKRAARRR